MYIGKTQHFIKQ